MENKSERSFDYKINLCFFSLAAIMITVMVLYLPNEVDGLFIGETYYYGIKTVVMCIVCVLLFNLRLFLSELSALFRHKNKDLEVKKLSRLKISLCAISIVFAVLSFLGIGMIKVEDESIVIKNDLFSKEKIFSYHELEQYDLFISEDDGVYWGKNTQDTTDYFNYDVYLGKAENIDKLIELINENADRELRI